MKISCIIPLYNSEQYLGETLDSVVSQDWPLHEIIVVDDGSTDNSRAILDRYAGLVRVFDQPRTGEAAARNRGLREAAGDVIAFLDSDDIWPPGRLRRLAEALQNDPLADIMGGLVETLDQRAVKPALREQLETTYRPMLLASLLIRRRVFDRVGLFSEKLTNAIDTEFIMRCRQMSVRHRQIDATTLIYRLHATNNTSNIEKNLGDTLQALRVVSTMRRGS